MANDRYVRQLPGGAEVIPGKGVHFRVWAPKSMRVQIVLHSQDVTNKSHRYALSPEENGYFSGDISFAKPNDHYWYLLDHSEQLLPDPYARFQPQGPHGPSQIIDEQNYRWTDHTWQGVLLSNCVIYEMHIGTFTPEGTWPAATAQLAELADFGINLIELMPIADFPGRFGWGYDGVNLFAPTQLYGTPEELKAFIDEAHRLGIGVILDVVYNHFGPDGNYLPQFSDDYFSKRHKNDWGLGLNYDGDNCAAVREFVESNAIYWIEEYHFDGLRLDATQDIKDDSPTHIMTSLIQRARAAAGDRSICIVAENEPQNIQIVEPVEQGGYGADALWNDDFHHSAMVSLSGHNEAYYTDYRGSPQEFISSLKRGYLYQGQWYKWQKKRRGTSSLHLPPQAFIHFLQNHDQIANSARGLRCHALTSPGHFRALTALMLLGPQILMLFQGQEFAASNPFFYFADHPGELGQMVHAGRKKFLAQFPSLAGMEIQNSLPNPADPRMFSQSKLDFSEREKHADIYRLHRDLLRLRREDPLFKASRSGGLDGAVLGENTFVVRFFADANASLTDRLLLVNLGPNLHYLPAPEPLLAPPAGMTNWRVMWSSEDLMYGGTGTAPVETNEGWQISGYAAVVMCGEVALEDSDKKVSDSAK